VIGGLITAGKFGWAAISGVDALADAFAKYTVKMVLSSRSIDADAAEEMVRRMQAAVPQDTGLLFSGIEARQDEDTWTVSASAVHSRGSWYDLNYAFLVEHGTQAGVRGGRRGTTVVVGPDYFDGQTGARVGKLNPATGRRARVRDASRRSARTHPGTKPQPFFYPAVDAVMAERALRQEDSLGDL